MYGRGAVIHDDDLEDRMGLRQNGMNRLGQKSWPVESRDDYGNFLVVHVRQWKSWGKLRYKGVEIVRHPESVCLIIVVYRYSWLSSIVIHWNINEVQESRKEKGSGRTDAHIQPE